jgi:hypothetical protein
MSQFSADRIARAVAARVIDAWPVVEDKIDVQLPSAELAAPRAAVVIESIEPVPGAGVRRNRWQYTIRVYGRFVRSGNAMSQKEQLANDLYASVIPTDGRLIDSEDNLLAFGLRCQGIDLREYAEPPAGSRPTIDVSATFSCFADAAYYE